MKRLGMIIQNHFHKRLVLILLMAVLLAAPAGSLSPARAEERLISMALPPVVSMSAEGEVASMSAQIFSKMLKASGLFDVREGAGGAKGCSDAGCARAIGIALGAAKTGLLTVEKEVVVRNQELTRYVSQKTVTVTYTVGAKVIDSASGGIDCEFTEKASSGYEVQRKTLLIAERIIERYRAQSPDGIAREGRIGGPFIVPDRVSLYPSYMKPQGDYARLFGYGLGVGARLGGYFRDFRSARFFLDAAAFRTFGNREEIDSMQSMSLSAAGGYSLRFGMLETVPYLGAGYLFNAISGDRDSRVIAGGRGDSREIYYNPQVTGGVEMFLSFGGNYRLFMNPMYGVFFEKESRSPFMQLNAGITRRL